MYKLYYIRIKLLYLILPKKNYYISLKITVPIPVYKLSLLFYCLNTAETQREREKEKVVIQQKEVGLLPVFDISLDSPCHAYHCLLGPTGSFFVLSSIFFFFFLLSLVCVLCAFDSLHINNFSLKGRRDLVFFSLPSHLHSNDFLVRGIVVEESEDVKRKSGSYSLRNTIAREQNHQCTSVFIDLLLKNEGKKKKKPSFQLY